MRVHTNVLELVAVSLLLCACGGSGHSRSGSTAGGTDTRSGGASATSSAPSYSSTGTTAIPPPKTQPPAGGTHNARVPATFTILPGGALKPQTVSSPAFIAIQLTISSGDGKGHQVVVRTPAPRSLAVPANGRASVQIPGLKQGRYPLQVDGTTRGELVIGGEPGP